MRFLTASLMALGFGSTFFGGMMLGGSIVAHAETPPPTKTIQIWNNEPKGSSTVVYPVLEVGIKSAPIGDNWMIGWFQNGGKADGLTVDKGNFTTSRVYRLYVNGAGVPSLKQPPGLEPGDAVEVTLPFFTRLVAFPPNPAAVDQYVDWWNGGRTYVYDDAEALTRRMEDTLYSTPLPQGAIAPTCKFLGVNSWKTCTLDIRYGSGGLPDTDLNQLTEYTLADTITSTWPYGQNIGQVGYNISSVDQTYAPVAMAPIRPNLPPIPYIGTNQSETTFRATMNLWIGAFPGYPLYNTGNTAKPRIPGAYIALTNAYNGSSLLDRDCRGGSNPKCSTIYDMIAIYTGCLTSTAGICQYYNPLINQTTPNGLFWTNEQAWAKYPCADPAVVPDTVTFVRKIYGFVPFNEKNPNWAGGPCDPSVNSLKSSAKDIPTFQQLLTVNYVQQMQQNGSNTPQPPYKAFNPYALLIGANYLNESVYAFSVDDDIGFQSYAGSGIVITFSGDGKTCPGLPLCTPLDRNKRVEFSLSQLRAAPPVPQWAQVAFCGGSVAPVDPNFPSFVFYPQAAPCHMTVTDLAGQLYQFDITALPQLSPPNPRTAVGNCVFPRLQNIWCPSLVVDQSKGPYYNYINAGGTTPGPVPSSHDFDGNGYSDFLLIDKNTGNASIWLYQPGLPIDMGGLGNLSGFTSVGQHDFDRDGKADLLWRSTDGNGLVILWMMNGKSIVPVQPIVPPALTPSAYQQWVFGALPTWNVVGTGDFNGSGLGSILWKDTNDDYALWNINGAAQQVVGMGNLGNVPSSIWRVAGLGDFDHDGMTDILWQSTAGDLSIWFMINTSVKSTAGVGNVGTSWIVVGTGDFNGDGNADILFRYNNPNNANDPGNGTVAIWLMNGTQIVSSGGPGALDPKWSLTLTGDYNRDGKSDILVRYNNPANAGDPANGATGIWFMNGLNIASTVSLGFIPANFVFQNTNAE